MTQVDSFADDLLRLTRAERYARFATLSNAELESLGRQGRCDVLASLIVNAETSHQVGRLESVSQYDIEGARQQAAAAAFARGDMKTGISIGSERSFDRLCYAVLCADWEGVFKTYDEASSCVRESAEALLLYSAAISATDGLGAARHIIDHAVISLFIGGDALSPCFWGAFEILPADDALRATVICAVALGAVQRFNVSAFQLIEPIIHSVSANIAVFRVAPEILWPVLEALIQRREVLNGRQLQTVAQHMAELAELVDDNAQAARAYDIAARAAFASGRTALALASQRRRAEHLGVDQERRRASIWSARQLKINEARSEAYAEIEEIDGDAWVAALREARVISGRSSSGPFHHVQAFDGRILMEGLQADALSHIGADGSPFRARAPSGDVLVDISARPQPWRVLEPAVLIGGAKDDDIWLLECLPKIDLWRRSIMGRTSEVAFFIDHHPGQRQKEVLGSLDLVKVNFIHSDPYYDRVFDKLYVPAAPTLNRAVDFLRHSFLTGESNPKDLLYIHPASDDGRVSDQIALARAMIDRGAKTLFLEQQAMSKIALALSAAKLVVRWAGAGDAYLAFCSPGARVVEIVDPQKDECHRSRSILGCVGASLQRLPAMSRGDGNRAMPLNLKALLTYVDDGRAELGEWRH